MQIGPGKCTRGTVKKRAVGPDGQQRGRYDDNPYLNSIVYEVEFDDGTVKEYAANIIAENMLMDVDDEGYSTTMIEAIVNFQKDEAVAIPMSEKYVYSQSGQKRKRVTGDNHACHVQAAHTHVIHTACHVLPYMRTDSCPRNTRALVALSPNTQQPAKCIVAFVAVALPLLCRCSRSCFLSLPVSYTHLTLPTKA